MSGKLEKKISKIEKVCATKAKINPLILITVYYRAQGRSCRRVGSTAIHAKPSQEAKLNQMSSASTPSSKLYYT